MVKATKQYSERRHYQFAVIQKSKILKQIGCSDNHHG